MTIIEATTRISLRNILFATDFSQYSTAALPYAVSLAAKHGAKVLAAHIVPAPVPAPSGSWDVTVERTEREAREKLEKIAPILHGVPHELMLGMGSPWKMLSEIIRESQVDLVVIGTHGRTGTEKLLMVPSQRRSSAARPARSSRLGPQLRRNRKAYRKFTKCYTRRTSAPVLRMPPHTPFRWRRNIRRG